MGYGTAVFYYILFSYFGTIWSYKCLYYFNANENIKTILPVRTVLVDAT